MRVSDVERFYKDNGYLGPVRAFDPADVVTSNLLQVIGTFAEWPECRNRHLDSGAVAEVCRSPAVVAAARAVLGPNVLLWRSNIFAMSASSYALPWHQDAYNDVLECRNDASHCSVQINVTDASPLNCVAVIPGSHSWSAEELNAHGYKLVPSGSNTPVYDSPEDIQPINVRLRAGEFYVFHPRLLHSSMLRGVDEVANHARRPEESIRYSITLRIAQPAVQVLPDAFAGTPTRAACVLLCGDNANGVNALGSWAA